MPHLDAAPLHVDTILSKISNQLVDHNHRFWSNKKLSPKRYLLPICIHLNLLCKPSGGSLKRQKQLDDIDISFLPLKRGFNPSHVPPSNLRRSLKTIKQVGNKSCIWIIRITISHTYIHAPFWIIVNCFHKTHFLHLVNPTFQPHTNENIF